MSLFVLNVCDGSPVPATPDEILRGALAVLARRVRRGVLFDSPAKVREFLCVSLAPLEHEEFAVIFLDSQHRLIEFKRMFRGSLAQTSVYPREVAKEALRLGAGAVILAHNHPSGSPEPSRADEALTQVLKQTLALLDVRVLDHIVVAGDVAVSFAERGML